LLFVDGGARFGHQLTISVLEMATIVKDASLPASSGEVW
jgi:hypothetical protein